jgi:predicted lipoprotein with Yx(FWY)xxD motif
MIRNRAWWWTLSALVLAGALLVGCGGGSSTSTTAASDPEAETADDSEPAVRAPSGRAGVEAEIDDVATPRVAVLRTMTPDPVRVVVDAHGMTVYQFRRDNPMVYEFSRDPVPTCYDACMATWTPLLTDDAPKAMAGAHPSMLGTIKRRDGGTQVTYDGHPLYLFRGDRQPGEMNGQEAGNFGAAWHAVEHDGDELIVAGR